MPSMLSMRRICGAMVSACVAVLVAGSGCTSNPVAGGSRATIKYLEAKQQLAKTLQASLAGGGSDKYRLLAVSGPAYPIGTALDPNNPVDLVTRSCLFKELPPSEPWSSLPKWQSNNLIGLNLGWPAQFQNAAVKAGLNINQVTNASFEMSDISQVLVGHGDFVAHIGATDCLAKLDTLKEDVLIVRGIVSGREVMESGSKLQTSATTHVLESAAEVIRVSFDKSGNFELRDERPVPKFLVVTRLAATERTTIENALIPPTDTQLRKVEEQMAAKAAQQVKPR
jgi:hypothetical protein